VPLVIIAKNNVRLLLGQKLANVAKVNTAWLLAIVQVIAIKVFHIIAPAVVVR
jgi:uncharacterized membrane protein YobD (UPF0266 family)